MDPEQLLDLARREADSRERGAPRQANPRRSVSTAYYAVFHTLLARVADAFAGTADGPVWNIFFRALNHGDAKSRCLRLGRSPLATVDRHLFKRTAFSPGLRRFAGNFVRLQELRHACDYDPKYRIDRQTALNAIDLAVIQALNGSALPERREFPALFVNKLRD